MPQFAEEEFEIHGQPLHGLKGVFGVCDLHRSCQRRYTPDLKVQCARADHRIRRIGQGEERGRLFEDPAAGGFYEGPFLPLIALRECDEFHFRNASVAGNRSDRGSALQ
jgi:hypothetical protein